jgi:hypothetical protein
MVTDYDRQTVIQKPSRFVTDVPADMYDIWSLEEEGQAQIAVGETEPRGYIN